MADDLRARLAAILAKTPAQFLLDAGKPEVLMTFHGEGRGGHQRDGACALCRGEIDTLLDAIMPVVGEAIRHATVYDCCGQLLYGPHTMACREYAGLIEHWRVLGSNGEMTCTCGWPWPAFGEECHNAAEAWRGPEPEDGS